MESRRRAFPYALAALGAAGLLVSLWLSWYSFTIPAAFIDQAESVAGQFGALAPLITRGAELARHLGELHVSGWRVLNQVDVLLALAAGLVGGISLLALTDRALGAGRLIAGAGTVALVLCSYRTIVPPGPADILHPAAGAYLALGSSVAVLAAGLLAGGDGSVRPASTMPSWRPDPSPAWPAGSPETRSASSVAPPSG